MNVSFVMILMLGFAYPIYARQGDKIFDYMRNPFFSKNMQTSTSLSV